jgi:SAM-dependent methyltransferase
VSFFGELYLRSTQPFLRPEATRREAAFIARALELRPGGRVLDVGCGHGRHLALLADQGISGFGLERDALSLRSLGPELRARAVRADLYHPPFGPRFDAAYAWYATLFISDDDRENQAALVAAAGCVRPGGALLVHGHNPATQRQELESRFESALEDGARLVEETWYDPARDVLHGHRVLTHGARRLEGRFVVRCPTLEDHRRWAAQAGLGIDGTWGDAAGGECLPGSPDLIVRYRR